VLPGAASASTTLWVASGPASPPGTSCPQPGYNTIQAAINAAPLGATIRVCEGTYTEQLQITHGLKIKAQGIVKVKLPATPANSTTACDTAKGTEKFQPDQDLVVLCGSGGNEESVLMEGEVAGGLTFEANWPEGTCDESLFGILVAGGSKLNLKNASVVAAGAVPLNGCQGGVGIQVGMAWTEPVETARATLTKARVSGYQKNGITVDGEGSRAIIKKSAVIGAGPTPFIAQNGIQVSNGAYANILSTEVTGNECNDAAAPCGPDSLHETQSTGVLFFCAASGSIVTKSTINENDVGVYYADSSASPPASPQVTVSDDTLNNDRFESVLLDQGSALVNSDHMTGGNVGVQVLQYAGQSYGDNSTGSGDVFMAMKVWGVQGYSDENPADHPGSFKITSSKISGNPGQTVATSVHSNSPTLVIETNSSDE
jgi:hypothetical protein